ncbi:MAG: propionyl-CoA carboxylase subunit alpha [Pseudomonadota bacterium]|jgi:propionyl-CoA carboxylase alpha chain
MFSKILIANRGEIACRVIRTARAMGIKTVAVYSAADLDAVHVRMADEAVCIGPAPARESYLCIDKIIAACKETGAQAVHPGYGFLSEKADFARALEAAGITFIGPTADAIDAMGDKIASKKLALQAGVNTIPGYTDVIQDADQAVKIARDIGYPVMIKASAGGGGKGLRVAHNEAQTREGFESCRVEARNAFGDDRVFIEKFIEQPRHIEIQVLGDAHDHVVYLWERECSLQRRHQKVIEEAPSPFLDETTRKAMGAQAVALARAVNYRSAGTVEFVVGADRQFYFLEMNTRLQVEHPVTEMITGLDLVEQMIRIAAGEPLSFTQKQIPLRGWAMECRINAEDPTRNFLPSIGRLTRFIPPQEISGQVRVDTGVEEGGEISMHYDSMIAKLITHGASREQAISRMREALNAFVIRGVSSNVSFQSALMQQPKFMLGQFSTAFIADNYPDGFHPAQTPHEDENLLIAVAGAVHRRYQDRASRIVGQMPGMEFKVGGDFVVLLNGTEHPIRVIETARGQRVSVGHVNYEIEADWQFYNPVFAGQVNGQPLIMQVERLGLKYRLIHRGRIADVEVMSPRAAQLLRLMPKKAAPDRSKFLLSPMPGLLATLAVKTGQEIKAGERLATIEAMKMENVLRAEMDGTVAEVLAQPGESLAVDQAILRFA